jgi:hypothetical protein
MWGYNVFLTGDDRVGSMTLLAAVDCRETIGPGAEAGSGWE